MSIAHIADIVYENLECIERNLVKIWRGHFGTLAGIATVFWMDSKRSSIRSWTRSSSSQAILATGADCGNRYHRYQVISRPHATTPAKDSKRCHGRLWKHLLKLSDLSWINDMHTYSQDLHNYVLHIPLYSCILSMDTTFWVFRILALQILPVYCCHCRTSFAHQTPNGIRPSWHKEQASPWMTSGRCFKVSLLLVIESYRFIDRVYFSSYDFLSHSTTF